MRAVLLSDLDAAARAVQPLPGPLRRAAVVALLQEADTADRFRRRLGRAHPSLGNGSLLSAARNRGGASAPLRCDGDYCAALAEVLAALEHWRARQPG